MDIFRLDQSVSKFPARRNTTTSSRTTNPNVYNSFDQLEQILQVCFPYLLRNSWKFRVLSLGIGCWIRWTRYSRVPCSQKNSQRVESNKGTTIYSSFVYGQNSRSSCAHEFSNEAFEVAINHDGVILDDISICSVNRKFVISWTRYFVEISPARLL